MSLRTRVEIHETKGEAPKFYVVLQSISWSNSFTICVASREAAMTLVSQIEAAVIKDK